MTALLPILIPIGEALVFGIGTAFAAHTAGGDWQSSLVAGFAAAIGKAVPSQVVARAPT